MYSTGEAPNNTVFNQPNYFDQSYQPQAKIPGRSRVIWVLVGIIVVCVAVAIGAGLGAGLAAQHRSSSFSGVPSGVPSASTKGSDLTVTTTLSGTVTTRSLPSTTLPYSPCPAANGSTYTATNKPLPTMYPQVQSQTFEKSFFFEILCYTTFNPGGNPSIMDLQILPNTTSLSDCLDACALYNFQMSIVNFPAYACRGVGWGRGEGVNPVANQWPVCWLKSNVSLGSPNATEESVGYDGAVLLSQ